MVVGGNTGMGQGGVYRTTDAGNSFTQCNWYPSSAYLGAFQSRLCTWIETPPTSTCAICSPARRTLRLPLGRSTPVDSFISYDRGVNWTQLTGVNGAVIPMDWSDFIGRMASDHGLSGSVWVALSNLKLHWARSGAQLQWRLQFLLGWGLYQRAYVDALKGNVVVYGQMPGDTWNKIYYSTNNGTNWGLVTATNYAFGNVGGVSLDPYRPGRIFLATGERSVGIFNPTNLVLTNQPPPTNPPPTNVPSGAPAIIRQPVSQSVLIGSTATLSVMTTGGGPLSYQWQFNTSNLTVTAPGPILTLPKLASSNAGSYDVVVSNALGSVTSGVAVLSVGTLPSVSIPPQNLAGPFSGTTLP